MSVEAAVTASESASAINSKHSDLVALQPSRCRRRIDVGFAFAFAIVVVNDIVSLLQLFSTAGYDFDCLT